MASRQIRIRQQSIDLQKHQAGGKRRPFVAIDERVIAAQIKKIRGGDFLRIGNQWCTTGRRPWRRNRGFQQRTITQSCTAAMRRQYLVMNGKNCCNVKMNQWLFRQGA